MKRLWKSSGFWTFIWMSIVLTVVYMLTDSEMLVTLLAGVGIIDKGGKAIEDVVNANKGVQYNEETKRHEKI